jgi:hypothetical protein
LIQANPLELRVLQAQLQIKFILRRVLISLKEIREVFVLKLCFISYDKGVVDDRDCDVLISIRWLIFDNFDLTDNLNLVRLQLYDLIQAVSSIQIIFFVHQLFTNKEVAHLTHRLKRFLARPFEEHLTLIVPDLEQVRAIVKALQFGISDLHEDWTVKVMFV